MFISYVLRLKSVIWGELGVVGATNTRLVFRSSFDSRWRLSIVHSPTEHTNGRNILCFQNVITPPFCLLKEDRRRTNTDVYSSQLQMFVTDVFTFCQETYGDKTSCSGFSNLFTERLNLPKRYHTVTKDVIRLKKKCFFTWAIIGTY